MTRIAKVAMFTLFCFTLALAACGGEDVEIVIEDDTSTPKKDPPKETTPPKTTPPKTTPPAPATCKVWLETSRKEVWVRDADSRTVGVYTGCKGSKTCSLNKAAKVREHALGRWVSYAGKNAVWFLGVGGGESDLSDCTYGNGVSWKTDVVNGKAVGGYVYIK